MKIFTFLIVKLREKTVFERKVCFASDFFRMWQYDFDFLLWQFFELVFYSCEVVSWVELCCCALGFFFVSASDALFCFIFLHTAKLTTANLLNNFFLSLTAFARVTSFLTLSKGFFSSFAGFDFDHT